MRLNCLLLLCVALSAMVTQASPYASWGGRISLPAAIRLVKGGNLKALEAAVLNGSLRFDLNDTDEDGNSLLHHATQYRNMEAGARQNANMVAHMLGRTIY